MFVINSPPHRTPPTPPHPPFSLAFKKVIISLFTEMV